MAIIDRTRLLTAEEYGELPDLGYPTELVRGQIVMMNRPAPRHGEVCLNVGYELKAFLKDHPLGRLAGNDSGVITGHEPDTVRGPDIAFFSYQRVPQGPLPTRYFNVLPELVLEVLSPSDRRNEVLAKVAEYLTAGVLRVCVVDVERELVTIFSPDAPEVQLTREQTLTLPEVLPGFAVPVAQLFA
ncbi:MAG: Uma2 family endonuclease [Planctomycetes bacterium]|nr:Uma2 family endonuclease [Planctomycetota bacterium]